MSAMVVTAAAALLLVGLPSGATGQDRTSVGPVVHSAGEVFRVPNPDFATPAGADYRLAFEMVEASGSPDRLNVVLNSVARYLNMHAQAGVPSERVGAAVVVHGPAGWELVDNAAYRERHGVENPNGELIGELAAAGVEIILCGQTAASRGIPRDRLLGDVQVALSAMTAFVVLQERGYKVNPW